MTLRGKKPTKTEKKIKALFFGEAGAGKTTAAIQFPHPYLIDTEKGSINDMYVDIINKNKGAVFHTTNIDEVTQEVLSLLSTKHDYRTLIIDPFTILYNDVLDQSENEVGSEFGRHYNHANKKIKRLVNLLLRLDMNVIITCHSKTVYGDKLVVLGQTFDGYKKLDYIFDLVFEIQKRGEKRFGIVKKTRVESFGDEESFEFSYDTIADKYGRSIIEAKTIAEELATKEQIETIEGFIKLLNIPDETVEKWLKQAQSSCFEEMSNQTAEKFIEFLKSKIEGISSAKSSKTTKSTLTNGVAH